MAKSEIQEQTSDYESHNGGEERKGHLLFGFVCDMRIAVVFVNIFNIIALIVGILITTVQYRTFGAMLYAFENSFLGIALSVLGILGALNYVLWMVAVATIGFGLGLLLDLFGLHLIGILIGSLVVYPHAMLTYEIKEGIMTRETYAREEHIVDNDFIKV
eukprot:scaffold1567_cov102-Cylindrotheca_fusiformis.AAC.3